MADKAKDKIIDFRDDKLFRLKNNRVVKVQPNNISIIQHHLEPANPLELTFHLAYLVEYLK